MIVDATRRNTTETPIGNPSCDVPTSVVNATLNKKRVTDESNAPFAFDGDIGINTLTIPGNVKKESTSTLDGRIAIEAVKVTVLVSPCGVRGNLGATISSPPKGPDKVRKDSKIVIVVDTVVLSEAGAECVHKVATKFIEGITPMAVCSVLAKVKETRIETIDTVAPREEARTEVECASDIIFDSSFISKKVGAADVGGKGSRETPRVTSKAPKGEGTAVDEVVLVLVSEFAIAEIPVLAAGEPDDETIPIHRIEHTAKKYEGVEDLSKPRVHSEITGDRAAAAEDDETTKAYAYINNFGSVAEKGSEPGLTNSFKTENTRH